MASAFSAVLPDTAPTRQHFVCTAGCNRNRRPLHFARVHNAKVPFQKLSQSFRKAFQELSRSFLSGTKQRAQISSLAICARCFVPDKKLLESFSKALRKLLERYFCVVNTFLKCCRPRFLSQPAVVTPEKLRVLHRRVPSLS